MIGEQDLKTLQAAGISGVDHLVRAAAEFLRVYPINKDDFLPNSLSIWEKDFLRARGALGVSGSATTSFQDSYRDNITIITAEYAVMAASALSKLETAKLLGVSASRVRQRTRNSTLYGIRGISGQTVFPRFQFFNGRTLPGLEAVLSAMNSEAHPVSVQRFFITPTIDLESAELTEPVSPRDWLTRGYSPDSVIMLAQEL